MKEIIRSLSYSHKGYCTIDKLNGNLLTWYPDSYKRNMEERFRFHVKRRDYNMYEIKDGKVYDMFNNNVEVDCYQ